MRNWIPLLIGASFLMHSCGDQAASDNAAAAAVETPLSGQSAVKDDDSQKDIVKVAIGSADHSTLVKAVQAAGLVDVLSNAGPFTVFAPTNAAFDKLPTGTLDKLMQPSSKADLENILQYHVYVGVIKTDLMNDGQILGQANGGNITISVKDGKVMVNGKATILASVPASNGIIHVIDEVLLP
ncbi:fasciclin domain-containing protein [Flavihumibacter cheonanensis]|uniref:fasciclin domain-containing protein n=1 Tax=Flavihumibacter cheonanensis TaxID=1442385 RepID=UPI001EF7B127|nr:fasciclin domain-containing protein [Flavihumibacter cheonanensis]MCG7752412.1 fasciclin domain-containing protein [Flavihumibacter cheonanensis]